MATKLDYVIEFYGETCPHCLSLKPVIADVEKELGVEITKLEVWNNEENKAVMQKYAELVSQACGGFAAVPAIVNTKTNQALCGVHEKEDIHNLIEGGSCVDNKCMPHTKLDQKPNQEQKQGASQPAA